MSFRPYLQIRIKQMELLDVGSDQTKINAIGDAIVELIEIQSNSAKKITAENN